MKVTSTALLADVGATPSFKRIVNDGPNTVYYKSDNTVSSSVNDGSIASGSSLAVNVPKWLACAAGQTSNVSVVDRNAAITEIVTLTQAEYDALSPDPQTLYVING